MMNDLLRTTIVERRDNEITFELFEAITVTATSFGPDTRHGQHEITFTFRDNENGEAPVIRINRIDYQFHYGTGRLNETGSVQQVTQANIRRAESGYCGPPPTESAQSDAYAMIRNMLAQIVADPYFGTFLQAGKQKRARSEVAHLQKEISALTREYHERIGELYSLVDAAGNLTGGDLNFPTPEWH